MRVVLVTKHYIVPGVKRWSFSSLRKLSRFMGIFVITGDGGSDLYLKASGKIKEKEDVQCAILLHVIGKEAMEIYNTFQFATEEDRTKLDVLKSKFEEYMNPRKNNVFERYRFREYKHQEDETIDQFITELKTRAKSCKFGDQYDSMIRDRIVFGVSCSVGPEPELGRTCAV